MQMTNGSSPPRPTVTTGPTGPNPAPIREISGAAAPAGTSPLWGCAVAALRKRPPPKVAWRADVTGALTAPYAASDQSQSSRLISFSRGHNSRVPRMIPVSSGTAYLFVLHTFSSLPFVPRHRPALGTAVGRGAEVVAAGRAEAGQSSLPSAQRAAASTAHSNGRTEATETMSQKPGVDADPLLGVALAADRDAGVLRLRFGPELFQRRRGGGVRPERRGRVGRRAPHTQRPGTRRTSSGACPRPTRCPRVRRAAAGTHSRTLARIAAGVVRTSLFRGCGERHAVHLRRSPPLIRPCTRRRASPRSRREFTTQPRRRAAPVDGEASFYLLP